MIRPEIALASLLLYAVVFSQKVEFYFLDFLPLAFLFALRRGAYISIVKQALLINIFLFFLFVTLLLSGYGLESSSDILLRSNAILLFALVLYFKNGYDYLLRGLLFFRFPDKFCTLLFLSLKQIEILKKELVRFQDALKARGFSHRLDRMAMQTYGNMVGFMILASLRRTVNLSQAMALRGFQGKLVFLDKSYNVYLSVTNIILITLFICKNLELI